jgi:MFS family permease
VNGDAAWRSLLTEPARPSRVRDSPHAAWLVVGTVCIGAFMGQLDASSVTLALPTLQHEFQASLGEVEWVALAYLIVLVGVVTVVGRVADMAGRKLLYTYGFGVFTLGAALCGLAPSLLFLDGARGSRRSARRCCRRTASP